MRPGPFHVLFNNAGMNRPALAVDVTESDYDQIMGLNVKAAYFTAQTVARSMIDAGVRGSIINVSSQMGHVGAQGRTVYCASKHAIEGFTRALAWEVGETRYTGKHVVSDLYRNPDDSPDADRYRVYEEGAFEDRLRSCGHGRRHHGCRGVSGFRCLAAGNGISVAG